MTASISSFRPGLRAKLSLAIAAALIAITGSGAYLVWRLTSAQIYHELGGHHHDLVRQLAVDLDGKLRIARTSLERIALATPPEIAGQPEEMQRYIEDKPVMLGLADCIVVLSKSGEIVAHVPRLEGVRGHSMTDTEHFRHVLRTRKPYISKPFRGPYAGQPVVHVAVPHFSEQGELKLVYAGVLYLLNPDLMGHARGLKVGKTGYFVIADPDRTIIAHPDATRVLYRPQPNADPLLERMLAHESGTEILTLADGTRAYMTVTRLAEADWTIAAVLPEAEALAPLDRARAQVAGLTAVALLLCTLFAWLIAGPMTRRLDALAVQVRVARGNPGARLTAHAGGADEIAELGVAFNDLLESAEKRERQNLILALAVDQANEAVLLADTEGRLTRWNRGAEQMFGWTAAEALGRTVRELHAPMISEAELHADRERLRTAPSLQFEARRQHKSGRLIDIAVTSTAVRDETGRILGTLAIYTDVTQTRRAQQAVRESEERLKLAQKAGRIVSWVWEAGADAAQWSGPFEEMLGLEPGTFSGSFRDYLGYVHRDDRDRTRRVIVECLKGVRADFRMTDRVVWADGSVHWLEMVGRAFFGADGRAVNMAGVARDITQAKISEQALHESRERFEKAFQASPDAITLVTLDEGRIVEANEGFERLTGYRAADAIGRTSADLGLWADAAQRSLLFQELRANRAVRDFEVRFLRRDGTYRDVAIYAAGVEIGGVRHALAIIRDITERNKAEAALRSSEEKFSKAFHASPDSIALSKLATGEFLEVNEGFERISGYSRGEAIGRTAIELGLWTQPDQRAALTARLASGGAVHDLETVLRRKDGEERVVLISLEALDLGGEKCMLTIGRDVTEAKLAEQTLRDSEERFAKAFNAAPDSITIARKDDGQIVLVNEGFVRMYGYAPSEAIGKTIPELAIWPESSDRARMIALFEAQGRLKDYGATLRTRAGALRDVLLFVEPIRLAGGEFMLVVTRDVTERKRAEEALRASEATLRAANERLRMLVQSSPLAIYTRDRDGLLTSWNPAAERMYGWKESEVLGKPLPSVPDEARAESDGLRMRLLAGEEYIKHEVRRRRRDGNPIDIDAFIAPLRDDSGNVSGIIAVVADVTERKQAETARRRREEGLRKLDHWVRLLIMAAGNQEQFYLDICTGIVDLVNADIGALPLIDADGKTFTYRAASGANAGQVRGQTLPLAGGGLCGWVAQHGRALLVPNLLADSRAVPELAQRLDVATGLLVPLAHQDQVFGGLSAFRKGPPFDELDLEMLTLFSQRVAMAMDNMRLLLALEQRVAERTAELRRANRELEGFSYTVSHDLRAPLRAILGFSQILSLEHAERLPEDARRLLARVGDNARRMSDLINDLLEFSRVGRKELAHARIEMRALVAEVLAELEESGARGNAELEVGGLPDASGDRAMLKLVWMNLIGNACKFSRLVARPMVRVSGEVRGRMVEFSVRDNGAGFDMRYAHKLFGVFQRLHSEAEFEGTGAGLSIVQRIVERHGGKVSAEGESGKGATFRFSIPGA